MTRVVVLVALVLDACVVRCHVLHFGNIAVGSVQTHTNLFVFRLGIDKLQEDVTRLSVNGRRGVPTSGI